MVVYLSPASGLTPVLRYLSPISPLPFVLFNLLAGKCSLAIRGRGARVFWSNPRTQTNPASNFRSSLSTTGHMILVQLESILWTFVGNIIRYLALVFLLLGYTN